MTGVTPFEVLYNKAKSVIKEEGTIWMTTEDVIEEIKRIKDRRSKIYKNIISFTSSKLYVIKKLTMNDVYKRCFKSALERDNRNDEKHIKNLFDFCLSEMKITESHRLDEGIMSNLSLVLYPVIQNIRVQTGAFISKFIDPNFSNSHLITTNSLSSHLRKLVKAITEKIGNASIKMDIKIISSVICYGHDKSIDILFLSCDHFFSGLKNEIIKAVRDYFTIIRRPLGITIDMKHLDNFP